MADSQVPIRSNKVDMLSTKDNNMKQRRVINAANAQDQQDYITLNDLNTRLQPSAYTDTTDASNIGQGILDGNRLPNPQVNKLGGIKAASGPVSGKVVQYIDTKGVQHFAAAGGIGYNGPTHMLTATAARTFNTVYLNPNTTPLYVSVSVGIQLNVFPGQVNSYVDAVDPPAIGVNWVQTSNPANYEYHSFSFIVPVNWYYKVTNTGGSCVLELWIEWW